MERPSAITIEAGAQIFGPYDLEDGDGFTVDLLCEAE
jgi:hypothetical protein